MRIDPSAPRREIKQLQAHCEDDPRHYQTRPSGPGFLQPLIASDAEDAPHQVLNYADHDVSGHVVCVRPAPKCQVGHVGNVEEGAEDGPEVQDGSLCGLLVLGPIGWEGKRVAYLGGSRHGRGGILIALATVIVLSKSEDPYRRVVQPI